MDTVQKKRGGQKGNKNAKGQGAPKKNKNATGHGAPKKNRNAAGHGAPKQNKNAETHGAYSSVDFSALSEKDKEYIKLLGNLSVREKMNEKLEFLYVKRHDLMNRIEKLKADDDSGLLYTDKEIVSNSAKGETTSTIRGSAFQRLVVLENVLNNTNTKIIKLLTILKTDEFEERKHQLEADKFDLAKQKAIGEFNVELDVDSEQNPAKATKA
ncbi:MAG: hypothetical protein FWH20_00450 [Oscillospiraceae bacterium]|nr:hypothetical protein [Oscillospiraceae bacterium]